MNDPALARNPVDLLAEEFAARLRAGETPSIDEYVRRSPDHAAEVRAVFPSIALCERVSEQEFAGRRSERRPLGEAPMQTLGDFRIVREVGRGGMGIVYEAVQSSLGRRVALKVLGPHGAGAQQELERFRREAEAVARLHHTNIVPIYGVGEEEGVHFYAMQFIEGASLAAVIRSVERLCRLRPADTSPTPTPAAGAAAYHPDDAARSLVGSQADAEVLGHGYWRGVARIVAAVADALAYAHRHGVLHRDIKPSNLLLDCEGGVWITDFGLAKQEDQEGLTGPGDIIGTLRYMAPEQLDGHAVPSSDVYSLGLTLFELLTLRPAYTESSHGLLIKSKTREAPPRPRALDRRIPADLETIALKCCARAAHDRYPTAEELADDLRRFLEDRPIRARRATAPERLWRWCRRNPVVASLGSATFMLLLALAIVFALGHYRTRQALARLEREHVRAETNLALAIRGFEQIIGNIASRGVPQPPDLDLGTGGGAGPEPVLSTADAELLKTLLVFFDRLANENGPGLQEVSASARRRAGDIQQRLGRFVEAEATYQEAFEAYTALSAADPHAAAGVVARASILNEMGVTASRRGGFMAARDHHVAARTLLEGVPSALASKPGRFELARTLMLLCSIAARNGVESLFESLGPGYPGRSGPPPTAAPGDSSRGPAAGPNPGTSPGRRRSRGGWVFPGEGRGEWQEAIQRSIDLVAALSGDEPADPEYRLFLARAYREQVRIARLDGDRALAERSLRTAIAFLDQLVSDFPTHPGYQSALAEMLCTPIELPGDPRPDPETFSRTERARELAEGLLAAYPQVPEHRLLKAIVLSRLAWLQHASARSRQARETYGQAVALEESLSREFPSVLHHAIALADSLQRLADVEAGLGRAQDAADHLESAIVRLEQFPKGNAARFLPPLIGRLRDRRAAIALEVGR
jgi:serine/threonine protein kinase